MNQNVFGVILFSIIVGTAMFVSEFFVTEPSIPTIIESPISPVYESQNRCSKRNVQLAKIKITQAVLNPQTNQLSTSLLIENQNQFRENVGVTLHFFAKDGVKTKYLASNTFGVQPSFDAENKANHEVLSSYQWLDNLDDKSNLYIIVEPSLNSFSNSSSPVFDESKAVPVLLMKGKN